MTQLDSRGPDDLLPEGVTDEWVGQALGYLSGEMAAADERAAFEAAVAADPRLRDALDELRAVHEATATAGDAAGAAGAGRDLWPALREQIAAEQASEQQFAQAVRIAVGEASSSFDSPALPADAAAVLDAAAAADFAQPGDAVWAAVRRAVDDEPLVAEALRGEAAHANPLQADVNAIVAATNDAGLLAPSRDLWAGMRERLAAEDRFAADVRAQLDGHATAADSDLAALFDAADAAGLLAPSRDLWADMHNHIANDHTFVEAIHAHVGERGKPVSATTSSSADAQHAGFVLDAAASAGLHAPSRDLWPTVRDRAIATQMQAVAAASTARAPQPMVMARILRLVPIAAGVAAAATLLLALLPGLLGPGSGGGTNTNAGTALVNHDANKHSNGNGNINEHVAPPNNAVVEANTNSHHSTPDLDLPLPTYLVGNNYADVASTIAAPTISGVALTSLDPAPEIVFCSLEQRDFIQVPFDLPRDLRKRLLDRNERYTELDFRLWRSNSRVVAIRGPNQTLELDFNFDANDGPEAVAASGHTVAFPVRSGRHQLIYPVRFEFDSSTDEWYGTPCTAMVALRSVGGRTPVLIDGNLNGRFDDFGVDFIAMHGEEMAVTLTRVVRIGDELYDIALNCSGTVATFTTYTGPVGRVLVNTNYRRGAELELLRLQRRDADNEIDSEVLLTSADVGREVRVPAGKWELVDGHVREIGGSDGMRVSFTPCRRRLELASTEVLDASPQVLAPWPDKAVLVNCPAHGPTGELTLGGPLRLVVEMPEPYFSQPRLEISLDHLFLIGAAGERYSSEVMQPTAMLMVMLAVDQKPLWLPHYMARLDDAWEPPALVMDIPRGINNLSMALRISESALSVFLSGDEVMITVRVY
ncbi:MAG: hypothetical protein AB7K09_19675 [Planctomycetota bacterium]